MPFGASTQGRWGGFDAWSVAVERGVSGRWAGHHPEAADTM